VELSTRPLTGSIGSDEMWENATSALTEALERHGGEYRISPGDGAFYGPKIDFHLKDSLNRRWQCGTIQVDFAMPERFDLEYVGSDGDRHRPVMVHRAIFGSLERFIAVLIEHHAGKLPVWLSPVQAVVMNITDAQADGVAAVHGKLVAAGIRSRLDLRNEKIGRKIREATLEKIPYMLVLGDREVEEGTVSVRDRTDGDLGTFSIEDFVARVKEEIRQRR
jgi:threonyl-tRNA synthetase